MRVKGYNLTRLTDTAMDVQIEFEYPNALATSQSDPDSLKIGFKNAAFFIDREQGMKLEGNLRLEIPVVPQKSEDELIKI